jgi:hypothetical protein
MQRSCFIDCAARAFVARVERKSLREEWLLQWVFPLCSGV